MTRKRRWSAARRMATLGAASALVLSAFNEDLAFFYSPSEWAAHHVPDGRYVRVGGWSSRQRRPRGNRQGHCVPRHRRQAGPRGPDQVLLPDLFREGQGVVVEGALAPTAVSPQQRAGQA